MSTILRGSDNFESDDVQQLESSMTNYINNKYAGFKNHIINGNMMVAQRGTTFINATNYLYTLDRWVHIGSTTGANVTQMVGNFGDGKGDYFRAYMELNITAASGIHVIEQRIENPYIFTNKKVTLSFTLHGLSSVMANNIKWEINLGHSGGETNLFSGTVTGAGRKSITVTIPSLSGYTFNASSYLGIRPVAYYGTDTWTGAIGIANVQLEEGSIATPFEHRPYGLELSLCQRYYEVINGERILCYNGTVGSWLGATVTSYWKSTKRVPPTVTLTSWSGTMTALPSVGAAGLSAVFTTPSVQAGTAQYGQFSLIGSAEL